VTSDIRWYSIKTGSAFLPMVKLMR